MRGSIGWHVAMLGAAVAIPGAWPWALGGVALNQLLLTSAGMLPRSTWLGANWRRLPADPLRAPAVALTFDDGPDPRWTPFVLDQLATHGQRASFFCIGSKVRAHPALARQIVAAGHSIENHSQHHGHHFALLGIRKLRIELQSTQDAIAEACGVRPLFFRAPAGLRNPLLQPVLSSLDLQLASWTRRGFDTVRKEAAPVLDSLTRDLAADDILLLHDGRAGRLETDGRVLQAVLPKLLTRLNEAGLRSIRLDEALPGNARPAMSGVTPAPITETPIS